jgi:hypothetical protein
MDNDKGFCCARSEIGRNEQKTSLTSLSKAELGPKANIRIKKGLLKQNPV